MHKIKFLLTYVKDSGTAVEVEADMIKCKVPWWDPSDGKGKAYREGADKPEEALGIIEGARGIALAVFPDGPVEVPGLTNAAWEALQAQGAAAIIKKTVQPNVAKPSPKKNMKKAGQGETPPHPVSAPQRKKITEINGKKLPQGWTYYMKEKKTGTTQGASYKCYVAPSGKEFDRWQKNEKFLGDIFT